MSRCWGCDAPLPAQTGPGRHRRYCDGRCKYVALLRSRGIEPGPVPTSCAYCGDPLLPRLATRGPRSAFCTRVHQRAARWEAHLEAEIAGDDPFVARIAAGTLALVRSVRADAATEEAESVAP